jgi:hypothetical protein
MSVATPLISAQSGLVANPAKKLITYYMAHKYVVQSLVGGGDEVARYLECSRAANRMIVHHM